MALHDLPVTPSQDPSDLMLHDLTPPFSPSNHSGFLAHMEHTQPFSSSRHWTYSFLSLEHSTLPQHLLFLFSALFFFIIIQINLKECIFLLIYFSLPLLLCSCFFVFPYTYNTLGRKISLTAGHCCIYLVNTSWVNEVDLFHSWRHYSNFFSNQIAINMFLICSRKNSGTVCIWAHKHPIRLVSLSQPHWTNEDHKGQGEEITCPQSHSRAGIWNQQFGSRVCEFQDTLAWVQS